MVDGRRIVISFWAVAVLLLPMVSFSNTESSPEVLEERFKRLMSFDFNNIEKTKDLLTQYKTYLASNSYQKLAKNKSVKIKLRLSQLEKYFNIAKYFDDCIVDSKSKQLITKQILRGSSTFLPCESDDGINPGSNKIFKMLHQELNEIAAEVQQIDEARFMNLTKNYQRKTLADSLVRFRLTIGAQSELSKDQRSKIKNLICSSTCNIKNSQQISKAIDQSDKIYQKRIKRGDFSQYSKPQVTIHLNKIVSQLNNQISQVNAKIKQNGINSQQVETAYEFYLEKYISLTSGPIGSLLLTQELNSTIRPPPSLKQLVATSSDFFGDPDAAQLEVHRSISDKTTTFMDGYTKKTVTTMSAKDILDRAVSEKLKSLSSYAQDLEASSSLDNLVKLAPIAIGKALIYHPQMLASVCQAVNSNVVADSQTKKMTETATSIVSGLETMSLALMPVGGIGLLPKGVLSSAKAVLPRVLSASIKTGVSASILDGAVKSYEITRSSQMETEIRKQRLALSITPDQYKQAILASETVSDHMAQLRSRGLGLTGVGVLLSLRKSGLLTKARGVSSKIANIISSDKRYGKLLKYLSQKASTNLIQKLNQITLLPGIGREKLEAFLAILAQQNEGLQKKVLAALQDLKINSSLRELINSPIKAIQCLT